jgi:FemAB-related protein (PEP-CTERM system-associated)
MRQDVAVGVLPLVRLKSLLFGDFVVSMPYLTYGGVVADDRETETSLIDAAAAIGKRLGVSHVELRHTSDVIDFPRRTEKVAMQLTLCGDSEELWGKLGSKRRAQIKRPQKEGAQIQVGGVELLQDFHTIFATKYRDLGVPVYPLSWFSAVFEEFEEHARIFVARIDEQAIAASIVLGYNQMLEVPWAASLRSADRLGINMFLYWEMLKYAEESGFQTFDFGRSTKDSGTWRFKKQWGAEPVQLYWHYWLKAGGEIPQLNTANPKYEVAVSMWRKMPLWATKLIGPRLVRNLP